MDTYKKWEVDLNRYISGYVCVTNKFYATFVYFKVEDITHVKAGEGVKPDETIFSKVPQSGKQLIAEISGMFDLSAHLEHL